VLKKRTEKRAGNVGHGKTLSFYADYLAKNNLFLLELFDFSLFRVYIIISIL